MRTVGYALVTLGAVALARGLWLLSPVAGWIGLALVAYVAGYHLSNRDGAPRPGGYRGPRSVGPPHSTQVPRVPAGAREVGSDERR